MAESESDDGHVNQSDKVDIGQESVDHESDDVHITQQTVKDDSESESESERVILSDAPPQRTRRGRVIKRPKKFGFE